MRLSTLFKHQDIGGKTVYVVDDHHYALAPWALMRRQMGRAPNLITLDHHTDVHEAFLGHAHLETYERGGDAWALARDLVKRIDWQNDQSLLWAIEHLRHDEHIDAATLSGVLNYAFCIQLSDYSGNPSIEQQAYDADRQARWPQPPTLPPPCRPMTYGIPGNHIFVISHDCAIGCNRMPHNDDCVVEHGNMVIESIYLDDQLARGAEMSRCVGIEHLEAQPYILDIDLDVFHSRQAIGPADSTTFYRLIRNAVAITVATEAECVEDLKFDGEAIDASFLLAKLIDHINEAIG
ncbi:MAG: hypothetical protein EKK46_11060 [Rhodocyclaceae bacterium]|nr:MAG: hypothetical protein EKK46_11060 [Rhodocyclaceae bacterium]